MTYEEAAAHYNPDTNPMWIACHADLGRRPAAFEFTIWNSQQNITFLREAKQVDPRTVEHDRFRLASRLGVTRDAMQAEYETWLRNVRLPALASARSKAAHEALGSGEVTTR